MVARNDVIWADLGGRSGRRPVVVLTRNAAVRVLQAWTCAPITRTVRGIDSEVEVGPEEGVDPGVVNCDGVVTVPGDRFDAQPVGRLGSAKRALLDQALRYSLDILY